MSQDLKLFLIEVLVGMKHEPHEENERGDVVIKDLRWRTLMIALEDVLEEMRAK